MKKCICLLLVLISSMGLVLATDAPVSSKFDWSIVRGFNYQPSFGSNATEIWVDKFDVCIVRNELETAKKHFPGMNTVRIWLSHDTFLCHRAEFMRNFKAVLDICHSLNLYAIPVLFNNWHSIPDFGGISPEMINYWFLSYGKSGTAPNYIFRPYFEEMFTTFDTHPSLLAWDMCNEPFNSDAPAITPWLRDIYNSAKKLGIRRPVGVSVQASLPQVEKVAEFSDVIMIHPYFADKNTKLPDIVRFASGKGKPVLATECCWGELDDAKHVELVRADLETLKNLKLGFLIHALYESPVGDLHRPDLGTMSSAGYMAFINRDGSLRKGHEIFNDYCPKIPPSDKAESLK
ncbi:MAG: cellulase family glycosylhydrolase [Lentisphaerota bacterium]